MTPAPPQPTSCRYAYLPGQYAAVPAGGVGVTIWTALNDNTFYTKLGAASTQHIFNRTVSASSTADNGVRGETSSADYNGVYGVKQIATDTRGLVRQ
jgi:hypothetical protein